MLCIFLLLPSFPPSLFLLFLPLPLFCPSFPSVACGYTCLCVHMCGPEVMSDFPSLITSHRIILKQFLSEPGAQFGLDRLAGRPQGSSSGASLLGLSAGDLNSAPRACVTILFLTKPSLHPITVSSPRRGCRGMKNKVLSSLCHSSDTLRSWSVCA